ncbi:MAG: hypothetical protein K2O18_12180 [Oscillospiraceae bacterium]|nr:hypothetical protein [Oscillospiraceae bacterium]
MKMPDMPDFLSVFQNLGNKPAEGNKRPAAGKNLEIHVVMMGGRRCGKTSVLAAMEDCLQRTIYKYTNITCYSDDDMTLQTLREKKSEMDAYFIDRRGRSFHPDSTPTSEVAQYSFCIGLRSPKRTKDSGHINLIFHDYPGEWLLNRRDDLKEIVEKSRIIIIAVDTPYMMEEKGRYNRHRNNCDEISNALIQTGFANGEPGMILFVPIKCEKYRNPTGRNSKKMLQVCNAIKSAYAPLLDYLTKSSECFAAITPVFTLGDAVFSDFERDENGDIIEDKEKIPRQANYIFTDNAGDAPNPQFCEQPLFYILAYTLAMAKRAKEKGGLFSGIQNAFQENILHWPSAEEYLGEYQVLCEKISETLHSDNGYEIVSSCNWIDLNQKP